MGFNRSALMAGLILTKLGYDGPAAVARLRERRPGALYNERFAEYLSSLPATPPASSSPAKEPLMLKEFREFAMRGNVVDMAVGLIIGAAFGAIVTSLVNDVIMPPIGHGARRGGFLRSLRAAEGRARPPAPTRRWQPRRPPRP